MSNEEHTMDGVQGFLSRLDLSEHLEMFVAKGFDSEDDLPYLVEEDLDAMYITDHRARQKILRAGKFKTFPFPRVSNSQWKF